MSIKALDSKVDLGMFLQSIGGRIQKMLASTLKPEEKLDAIQKAIAAEVQEKRVLVRQIGVQMRAIADPETPELEPLEKLQLRRQKLVVLGSKLVDDPIKTAQLGQVQHEIQGLDKEISGQQSTYDTLKESYDLAYANYKQALAALEQVRSNAPAILKAIQANKDALKLRDKVKGGKTIDTSFMDELNGELKEVQSELHSDKRLEADLDSTTGFNIDAELAKMDAETEDTALMDEFRAAAAKKI